MFDIVRGSISNPIAANDITSAISQLDDIQGTLFLGYPLSASYDTKITIDALLLIQGKGLLALSFGEYDKESMIFQDKLFYLLCNNLTKYDSLRNGRKLAFDPFVATYVVDQTYQDSDNYIFTDSKNIVDLIRSLPIIDDDLDRHINESIMKIRAMKPKKSRENVVSDSSKGSVIKSIEAEIANLDEWQKKAAFEVPESPQRIRGLAGSGKTVVLALKAAYLHTQHPDWLIAVTFFTRALSQQLKELITKFTYEFSGDMPDFDKLLILHSWGTSDEPGLYSKICRMKNIEVKDYGYAKSNFGRDDAFEGICAEADEVVAITYSPFIDVLLIDEAQDLPISFFKLCFNATKEPKRIVFAYDELQNLSSKDMPSIEEMFGYNEKGDPRINLHGDPEKFGGKQDIVLPICYRNTPWALTVAHALGFGIYRVGGLAQHPYNPSLWEDIGYRVKNGELKYKSNVALERSTSSYPPYFNSLISPEEAVMFMSFESEEQQFKWVADEIFKNIEEDELDPDDILVIFPDALSSKYEYTKFKQYLALRNINSVMAGISTDRNTFRVENYVTCSSIYRAKGNEAPMVYVLNSDYCANGLELIRLRNTLFTAMTRARAWVRVTGVGKNMDTLKSEFEVCKAKDFTIEFEVPSRDEILKMKRRYSDKTDITKKTLKDYQENLTEIMRLLKEGDLAKENIPLLDELIELIGDEQDGKSE